MSMKRRAVNKLLPIGSRRRRIVKVIAKPKLHLRLRSPGTFTYDQWIKVCEPKLFKTTSLKTNPLISIVVPIYNTPDRYFRPLLNSVIAQKYSNWQLCLVDASTDKERSEVIKIAAAQDKRVNYIRLNKNLGIAGNTNEGLKYAQGSFIGFADHDDVLSPFALSEVVGLLEKHKNADLIYSDEDKLSDDGKKRLLPFFKPDWSPSLLEGVNYMAHFVVVRKQLLDDLGGLRLGYDGAQDYDLLLRIMEKTDKIYHIPKILYHWRMAAGSTARAIGEKNYADDAGQKALAGHVKRQKIAARVVGIAERPTNYRLRYEVTKGSKASVIIPFKDKTEYLEKLIPSILQKSGSVDYEILLISNNSAEQKTHEYLREATKLSPKIKTYEYNKPFNWSAINNFGRSKAIGNVLVFLNNDTEAISDGWLEELASVAEQPQVGAAGPLLLYPDKRIQHAGVVVGMKTMAGHVFRFRKVEELTPFGLPEWPRNYMAVTGACLAVEAGKFDEAGGFDESMIVAGSDVAFCIRLYEQGYRNIYWPFAKLYHYESVSVGTYDNGIVGDYNRSLDYYAPYLNWNDPYFNQNLDIMDEAIALRNKYE